MIYLLSTLAYLYTYYELFLPAFKTISVLAIVTSIDALAVGMTFTYYLSCFFIQTKSIIFPYFCYTNNIYLIIRSDSHCIPLKKFKY
ncbi:manganese efflux pump [Sporanaerobium hydrogeniformans]|uniref:manganese efflux pump n=1 Tax=Sporanaerobium hydrogeniformans TaxID=3072179 RepID=UPI001179D247